MNLRKEILELISLKQEGGYWDFKREWYHTDKKDDLLHDIICMANNVENHDGYIIIGVDEECNYSIRDISNDVNRKNTQKIVDFLKDKQFAGGVRPLVYVEPLKIFNEGTIDVIVIKNSYNTPFYLTKRHGKVNANNVYTRVMDSNTAIDSSADLIHIEYLWKKRFRLISTPLERVKYYLQFPQDWADSPEDSDCVVKYYKYYPEYKIEYTLSDDESSDGYVYYLFNQTDTRPHWREINIFYYQTQIEYMQGICLDGGRYFTSAPLMDGVSLANHFNWDIAFRYFIKDSLNYIVHKFYYTPDGDEESHSHDQLMECVLLFDTENELLQFKEFVKKEWTNKADYDDNIHLPYFPKIDGYVMGEFEKQYKNVQILQRMLKKFRNNNF